MNYAQFKAYLSRFVWRDGDADFESELDNFIVMAHSRLNRDLRVQKMSRTQFATVPGDSIPVPPDYLGMRTLTTDTRPAPLEYVAPHQMEKYRASKPTTFLPYYTVAGDRVRFAGASVEEEREVTMTYYARVPDFQSLGNSWLADDYLDLYTYAVLRHTASYLRDDERVALWKNEYDESLLAAMDSEALSRYAGSPLTMPLPGIVA